jgi:CRP/FNR family transcriptional regulator, anaerobic regulatory protein
MPINFLNLFNPQAQLSQEDIAFCAPYFELINFTKNIIIEEENKVPSHLYFIVNGYMRLFYYDEQGDEVTTFIGTPNKYITSFTDFIHDKKSNQNLECITDCELYKIDRNALRKLIDTNMGFQKYSLVIFQESLAINEQRANDFATLSAEARYKKLMDNQAEIIQNVPIQYIASYLGIKPQSLSRIRKQMIK